ncbi:MAG: hypothetical protein LUD27_05035 [Clostridia bacterium]|nr:hypothetical protein [Clostridia bacterium]
MTLEYGSAFYFIYPCLCIALFFGLYFGLRHKNKKVQFWTLWGITMLNFVLHFVKLAFPPYVEDLPESIRKVTFENICAVSALVFPFFMLAKKRTIFRDYMFYLGCVSGFAAMFIPLNIIGLKVYEFETIRFYICHGSLWIVPLLMVIFGIHKLDYRRIWKVPLMYFLVLLVILFNEVALMVVGWVAYDEAMEEAYELYGITSKWEYFLSTEVRNSAFIFGPPKSMEKVAQFILVLTPEWFKPGKYIDCYMPILWEVVPVYIYGGAGMILMCLYWEHEHMAEDIRYLRDKVCKKNKRTKIKYLKRSKFARPERRNVRGKRYKHKIKY